jgi:hypothetical protein
MSSDRYSACMIRFWAFSAIPSAELALIWV